MSRNMDLLDIQPTKVLSKKPPPALDHHRLLTIKQIMNLLNVCKTTFYAIQRSKDPIPSICLPSVAGKAKRRNVRFSLNEYLWWIEKHRSS